MKRKIMFILVILIGVAFVTTVFAQTPGIGSTGGSPEKPAAPKALKTAGEFVSMDQTAKTMILKGKTGEMTFDLSKLKRIAEFRPGDKVMVVYTEKDGKLVALRTAVKPVKTEKTNQEKP